MTSEAGRLAIRPTVAWLLTTPSPFVEIALVLVRLDHIAGRIVNATAQHHVSG